MRPALARKLVERGGLLLDNVLENGLLTEADDLLHVVLLFRPFLLRWAQEIHHGFPLGCPGSEFLLDVILLNVFRRILQFEYGDFKLVLVDQVRICVFIAYNTA